MGKARIPTGFHRIEVEIDVNRWVAITAGDYYFGKGYPDTIHVARKKAENRLSDRRRGDPNRKYRLTTVGELV